MTEDQLRVLETVKAQIEHYAKRRESVTVATLKYWARQIEAVLKGGDAKD